MPPDPVPPSRNASLQVPARTAGPAAQEEPRRASGGADTEIFVWFEDLSRRRGGAAGLPECLLPVAKDLGVLERRYVEGHLHLLRAVRLRCYKLADPAIAALYVNALAAGTLAWIRTGRGGAQAWSATFDGCAD